MEKRLQDAHWQFSLALYAREGVADRCLFLQRELGLDVNVLLVMLWAAGQWRRTPLRTEVDEADRRIRAWREQVVWPLRQVRTTLRSGPAPAPDASTSRLREAIKKLELEAERIEQAQLADWVREVAPPVAATAVLAPVAWPDILAGTADVVLDFYLGGNGLAEAGAGDEMRQQCRQQGREVAQAAIGLGATAAPADRVPADRDALSG